MHRLNHLTLNTGHLLAQNRSDVSDEVVADLLPWLTRAIAAGQPVPVVRFEREGYTAQAFDLNSGLAVTVFGPPVQMGLRPPLVTFGVGVAERNDDIWNTLQQFVRQTVPNAPALTQPERPWCAVLLHPTLTFDPPATMWLGDFERCCAWAWASRHPELKAVPARVRP